jgi:hypothetical protein
VRVYVDSDILIWHLRGERKAASLLRKLGRTRGVELWVGAMQRAEILFFMRADEEPATMSVLSQLRTQAVTAPIVDLAGAFYRRWHASHGIDVDDALLAASVTTTGGRIVTQNVRHYPMPDVHVQRGW